MIAITIGIDRTTPTDGAGITNLEQGARRQILVVPSRPERDVLRLGTEARAAEIDLASIEHEAVSKATVSEPPRPAAEPEAIAATARRDPVTMLYAVATLWPVATL
jgi:hypothetical protein